MSARRHRSSGWGEAPLEIARTVALLSFRLGGLDGVSVVAEQWARCLSDLGWSVRTVAGAGPVDRLVPGLAWPGDSRPPLAEEVASALYGADLVVVFNLCSLPLRPAATAVVVEALRGRRAVLHHADLPWERARWTALGGWPADDRAWRHVVLTDRARAALAGRRAIDASVVAPGVDVDAPAGDGAATRSTLDIAPGERVLLHPARAIERKQVPDALALAEALGATYWLTGPAEEGYDPTLAALVADARCRVVHAAAPTGMADAYAAADAVALPSSSEGFGLPLLEAAVARRPLAVGRFPVAEDLTRLGFRWFGAADPVPLADFLADPDPALHDANADLVRSRFSLARVAADLERLVGRG